MRKIQFQLLVAFILTVGLEAQAVFLPNVERPRYKTILTEVDEVGQPVQHRSAAKLTHYRRDGQEVNSSFLFEETQRVFCITAPCPPLKTVSRFQVVDYQRDFCGSVEYEADITTFGTLDAANDFLDDVRKARGHVIDHTQRNCKDRIAHNIEVKLVSADGHKVRYFVGNAEPTNIIQSRGGIEE